MGLTLNNLSNEELCDAMCNNIIPRAKKKKSVNIRCRECKHRDVVMDEIYCLRKGKKANVKRGGWSPNWCPLRHK